MSANKERIDDIRRCIHSHRNVILCNLNDITRHSQSYPVLNSVENIREFLESMENQIESKLDKLPLIDNE